MTALSLVPLEHGALRRRALAVEPQEIDTVQRDIVPMLLDVMYEGKGIGLAAPQVGLSIRVIVWDLGRGPHSLINPVVSELPCASSTQDEGCLSLPGVVVAVKRRDRCQVSGWAAKRPVNLRATGRLARVVQHEVDHLNGILIA